MKAKKAIKFITEEPFDIRVGWINKNTFGDISYYPMKIRINIELLVVDTFIHEVMHEEHPEDTEGEIIKRTRKAIDRMTVKEIKRIYKILMRCQVGR